MGFKNFIKGQVSKAKTKLKDEYEFRKELSKTQKDAYRNEKFKIAKQQGKQKAQNRIKLAEARGKQKAQAGGLGLQINTNLLGPSQDIKPRARKDEYKYI